MKEFYNPQDRFTEIVAGPEDSLNLAEAALLLAEIEYPGLDISPYLEKLDRMADVVEKRLGGDCSVSGIINKLNEYLFDEQGYCGNTENYYDPRNSFLNNVMDSRMGIPVSLSLIYIELGQRLGIPLVGVSFPGHFLVKLSVPSGEIVIDPYHGGVSLSREDLDFRLYGMIDSERRSAADYAKYLSARGKKEMLMRILRNLKAVYVKTADYQKALNMTNQILAISPGQIVEIRERAYLFQKLDCFRAAAADYHRYLEMKPDADDREVIRNCCIKMQRQAARLH